jgi:hypothetical protein
LELLKAVLNQHDQRTIWEVLYAWITGIEWDKEDWLTQLEVELVVGGVLAVGALIVVDKGVEAALKL